MRTNVWRRGVVMVVVGLLASGASGLGSVAVEAAPAVVIADYVQSSGLVGSTASVNSFGKPCVGDLNADGLLDIVWSRHTKIPQDVYLGSPSGVFQPDTATSWRVHDNHGCVAADFSGDGRLDLFVTNGACNGNCLKWDRLWIQGVDGRFSEVGDTYLGPQTTDRSRDVVLLDADRDGLPDVFVNAAARAVLGSHHRLLRNLGSDGSGNWLGFTEAVAGVEQSGGEVSCAAAADFDADGWTDLAVCQRTGLFLFRNVGGTFQKHTAQLPGKDIRGVQFADFNGDGLVDLALAKVTGLEIRSNVGGGVFSTVLFSAPLATGWDVVAPDIDGDGDRDVFVTQVKLGQTAASTGAHSLWLNPLNGGGVWQRVLVPQPARGGGDKAEVFPNFRNSGRDALLVANGGGAAWGPAGPRQVLAVSGL